MGYEYTEENTNLVSDSLIRWYNWYNTQSLYDLFTKHPHKNKMTYLHHLLRAFKISYKMSYASFCLIIHGIFPFLFEKIGSNTIEKLYEEIILQKEQVLKSE
jgi:hypothetical protein